jgi:hypothetical protein
MDYDATDIPVAYDRGRDHGRGVLQLWRNVVSTYAGEQPINTILDLGYAEKIAAGADSVLARLSPNDFQAGMEALQSHAAHAGDKPVSEPIDIFVFR